MRPKNNRSPFNHYSGTSNSPILDSLSDYNSKICKIDKDFKYRYPYVNNNNNNNNNNHNNNNNNDNNNKNNSISYNNSNSNSNNNNSGGNNNNNNHTISGNNNNNNIHSGNGSVSEGISLLSNSLDDLTNHERITSPPLQSASPETNSGHFEAISPGESSRSFATSQKSSDEIGAHSPRTDSIGSRSPENLSSKKYDYSTGSSKILPDMLDHKLPLSFLGPPLAALHSMAEMKSPGGPGGVNGNVSNTLGVMGLNGGNSSMPGHASTQSSQGTANPHGIDTILSRPPPVTSNGLNSLTGVSIPRFSIAAAAAGMAQYLSQSQSGQLKAHSAQLVDRPHLYWPGLQGLVANPMAWRERLTTSMSTSLSHSQHNPDKDGKKKHTRPTFSGQQIFALEKTFEQTKYLAGPERAKLAYALGMTESQVKVWFQNRRTKWRKKHAAEMATAKRKQEELGDGDCSEPADSDSESFDLGEPGRKRCRVDDESRQ